MQDAKEEVRARLNIEDVVGEYVQLKRAGRSFKGLSPFSGEKTPSFFVSPDKQIWHDFSSNKGGDVFAFVMEVEGMDFRQALEHLARKAGVDLSMYASSQGSRDLAARKKRLLEANELAARYFQQSMLRNKHALTYIFQTRGLSKEVVQEFRIGYAPEAGSALVSFLEKKGFSRKELDDAGLTSRFGSDLFRGRMIVPLMDSVGQVIGFTGRIIADDPRAPKYLNTPQTLLYDKSRHVFGLSQAKEAVRTEDYGVIVEGNLDVVSSHQADVRMVVATAGTAMTEYHLKAMKRLTANIRLAFDGDKAGLAATERAIPIAQTTGVELSIITLPDAAKDPDELIKQDPALWRRAIAESTPVIDWVIDQYRTRHDLTTAAGKRSFTTAAVDVIRTLQDPVEREHYLKRIADLTDTSFDAVTAKLAGSENDTGTSELKPIKQTGGTNTMRRYDHLDTVIGLAFRQADVRDLFRDMPTFEEEDRNAAVRFLAQHTTPIDTTPAELQKYDEYVKIVLLRAEKRYEGWSQQDCYFEAADLLRQFKTEHEKQTLELQLDAAEAAGDETLVSDLRARHYTLMKEIKRGQR